jgi:hypothetical protein
MRDPILSVATALERDEGGLAIVWCPDLGLRNWLVGEVESLAPTGARPVRVSGVEEAIAAPDRMVLLVPSDERNVVLDLDASRDRLLEPRRTRPMVLFLLRDGDGQRALANDAPSLWSWAMGSDTDPEALAEIDPAVERELFEAQHHATPEAWLARWRAGAMKRDARNLSVAYHAMLLEGL